MKELSTIELENVAGGGKFKNYIETAASGVVDGAEIGFVADGPLGALGFGVLGGVAASGDFVYQQIAESLM